MVIVICHWVPLIDAYQTYHVILIYTGITLTMNQISYVGTWIRID